MDYGVISSMKVAEVMGRIDRAHFVPEGTEPYADHPMQIGYNATISAPHMHAMCLELLEKKLQPGMRALDVGSGNFCLCLHVILDSSLLDEFGMDHVYVHTPNDLGCLKASYSISDVILLFRWAKTVKRRKNNNSLQIHPSKLGVKLVMKLEQETES